MINSLSPSVLPATIPADARNEQFPANGTGVRAEVSLRENTLTARSQETGFARRGHHAHHGHHGHGKHRESEGANLFHTAKHMIKDAFKDFRHDLRDSFRDLGFNGGLAHKIAKSVMHATKDALRSGVDFSAKLMVAAISQTTSVSAAGTSSSFSMAASSIEVDINHTTGSIDVKTTKVSIESQVHQGPGATPPQLLDIHDSDQGQSSVLTNALLALQDLEGILDDEEDAVSVPPETATVPATGVGARSTARESVEHTVGQTSDTSPTRAAVDAVLQNAAAEEDAPAGEVKNSEATKEVSEETEEAEAIEAPEETELALPEIATPLLLNNQEYRARIFITAYEHRINEREERMTFLRFDAIVPLTRRPAPSMNDVPALPAASEDQAVNPSDDNILKTVA